MPIKLFTDGEILDASEVNTYFMNQALVVFDDSTQRDAAYGGSGEGEPTLSEGMICYLKSDDTLYIWTGSAWDAQLANIANGSITEAKIASGAVTSAKLGTSLSLTTPTLGVASATSINKVAITAPATGATLTLADGSTLALAGAYSVTLTATGATSITLPTTGTVATLAGTETLTNKTLTSPTVSGLYLSDSSIVFEGSSADANETTITVANPTVDRTITFPDRTGTVITSGDSSTVTETMIDYSTVPRQFVQNATPTGKSGDIWIKIPA